MKQYRFLNADTLLSGIDLLTDDLGITLTDGSDADLTVTVTETAERTVSVTLSGKCATIVYGGGSARFFRGLATLVSWVNAGETERTHTERPLFRTNGAMVDMSRNAVMNVKSVKTMLRKMALMGLNTYMLYTEDTYEVDGRPYFGYMRGRYTKNELKELDAYALSLGIELVPCVQMLGHLATHLRWAAAGAYKDTGSALLVGAGATYRFLDDILKTISECFTSRRLHMGMDETHDLGTGNYLKKNGYRERQDIYFEHLEKVAEMVRSYGFTPMMWSDMFFRLAGKDLAGYKDYDMRVTFSDEVAAKVPKGIQQVFWDYYNSDEEFYATNIDKHFELFGKDTLFAGGIWLWSSHCPLFSRSLRFTLPALDACRKKGVEEIFATIWLNGAEGNLIFSLAGLAWYADYDYRGVYDEGSVRACFQNACGVSYDDLVKSELPEHPDGGLLGLTRGLLYNDPLLGLVDGHLKDFPLREYYEKTTAALCAVPKKDLGLFAPAFEVTKRLSELLEYKADYGVRLKAAYDLPCNAESEAERNTQTEERTRALTELCRECDSIIERIARLRDAHRKAWMEYYKPFGWEVHDIRYGGMIARFETAKETLRAYLAGEIDGIPELEEVRLRLDGQLSENAEPRFHSRFNWMTYQTYTSPNPI